MRGFQPIPLVLSILLCSIRLEPLHAQQIRGRSVAAISFPSAERGQTGISTPQASTAFSSGKYGNSTALLDSSTLTASYVSLATTLSNLSRESLTQVPNFSAVSDNGSTVSETASSSSHFKSIGLAPASSYVPVHLTGLAPSHAIASGFSTNQPGSAASGFVPAFPTGRAGPSHGVSGAPSTGWYWYKVPSPFNTTRVFNATAFVQPTANAFTQVDCNTVSVSGISYCLPVDNQGEAGPFALVRGSFLVPSTVAPDVAQQTAVPDTQSSEPAAVAASGDSSALAQSQTSVETTAAAASFAPETQGNQPAEVALHSAQPLVGSDTQPAASVDALASSSPAAPTKGQTAVNTDAPAVLGGQTVGTSVAPPPQAQIARPTPNPDLIAGSLTFAAGPTVEPITSPVVIGGITYAPVSASALPAASPMAEGGSNTLSGGTAGPIAGQANAASESINTDSTSDGTTQSGAMPGSELSMGGQAGQENNVGKQPIADAAAGIVESGQSSQANGEIPSQGQGDSPTPAQANSVPIVVGGITYTPVPGQSAAQAANSAPLNLADLAGATAQPAIRPSVENGFTIMPVQAGVAAPTPIGVVGEQTIYGQGTTAVVGGQTITRGSTPISVGGTPVSLGPSAMVIGTNTVALGAANTHFDTVPTSVGVVGGQTIYRQGSSLVIGGQTVTQGDAPVMVDSTPVALGALAVVVGTNTVPLPAENAAVTGHAVYSFNGVAVTQGGTPVTISGTVYSLGPSFVVEGTKTIPLATATPSNPVLVIAGQTITANPTGFSIGSITVSPNGPAVTVSATVVSMNTYGVIVGSSTIAFPPPITSSSTLKIASQTLTALPSTVGGGFQIDHSTLRPGSSAVVISGTTYSLNAASSLIVGTSTIPLATVGPGQNVANGALTAGHETFTPLGSTAVMVNGTTLSLSEPAITENGTILSLASAGLIVGSSTYAFATPASNLASTTNAASPSVFTIDGEVFTADGKGKGLAIDGTELFQGSSAVTISGTTISLGSSALVIGTSTVPIASVTGLGPAISGSLTSSTPTASAMLGSKGSSAAKGSFVKREWWGMMIMWLVSMVVMTVWME